MRNSTLLRKTSSSQSICVSCACRLSGETIATRSRTSVSYAQRRLINGGPVSGPLQNGSPSQPTPQRDVSLSGHAAQPAFPDAASQARAALEAMNRQKAEQDAARRRSQEEASERNASRNLFGAQPAQRQQSINQQRGETTRKAQVDRGPRIRFTSGREVSGSNLPGPTAEPPSQQRPSETSVRRASAARDYQKQKKSSSRIITEVQDHNRGSSMPSLDVPPPPAKRIPTPTPKVQAPSWMISQPEESSSLPVWGVAPLARPANEPKHSFSAASQQPSANETVQAQNTAASDPFGRVDATRQALAKSQEVHRPNPLRNAMSSLRASQNIRSAAVPSRPSYQSERDAANPQPSRGENPFSAADRVKPQARDQMSDAERQTSALNSEEERLLQQLLARRSGQPAGTKSQNVSESQTVSYSPFGAASTPARSALAQQAENSKLEREAKDGRDRERKQRYRITMSNSTASEDTPQPFDPEVSSNWTILNRRQQRDQQESQETEAPPPQFSLRAPQDIDAKFEEYRRRRSSSGVDLDNIAYRSRGQLPPRRREYAETRTCARCGQQGHIAVNCSNAPKAEPSFRSWKPNRGMDASENGFGNEQSKPVSGSEQNEGGLRIRRVTSEGEQRKDEVEGDKEAEEEEDSNVSYLPARRGAKPRKFAEPPVEENPQARSVRRGRRGEDGEIDRSARARRGRSQMDDEEDVRPARSRRSRDEEEDDDGELSYADFEGAREKRMERKKARQAKKDKATKEAAKAAARQARKAEEQTQIRLPEFISVANLAQTLGVRYENFVRKMEELGFTSHSHDHILSAENASLIAMEYNFDPIVGDVNEAEEDERDLKARPEVADKELLPTRPPVVAIMGHVDHGKTTILDFLRKSSVAASEHGGITQHIGAFSVGLSTGKTITFLDTPGHAAFLEMRKRGATVTDIIILVVAADDSVKPQTIEAIRHAKAANVPVIVAINKIDKEEANIDRVKQDLARHEVEIEDFGGDTQVVPVSGKTGAGIDDLEDNIVTLSEILDHRAETSGPVEGWVIEATTKKAGRVATVLVRRGTLVPGNIIVAGKTWARVRSLKNEAGQTIVSAGPGTPVEVDGWKDQPAAGDEALQAPNEQKAVDVVDYRLELEERTKMAEDMEAINTSRALEAEKRERERLAAEAAKLAAAAGEGTAEGGNTAAAAAAAAASAENEGKEEELNATPGHQTVPFIIKADVSGSVEAVSAYLLQMSNPLVSPILLRAGVGPVGEFDLEHAAAAGGHIISFNLPHAPEMIGQAEKRGVKLIEENVIYRIVGDVKAVLEDKLPPLRSQRVAGEADVAMAFEIGVGGRKKVRIAGCKVRNGMIARGSRVRVLRGEKKIYDGILSSLKNVKKDVQEMRKGTECGMGFDGWEGFEIGDQIQTYEEKVEKRTLQI